MSRRRSDRRARATALPGATENARETALVEEDPSGAEDLDSDAPVRGGAHDRQWDVIAAVSLGGVLGAEARYGLSEAMPHQPAGFPWSTICINVIGCFCLGILMWLLGELTSPHRLLRPFMRIGVLGGFTTFSTFTVDTERLIQAHRTGVAGLYVLCTLVAAAAAVAAATIIGRLVGRYVRGERLRRADRARRSHRSASAELTKGRR